MVKRIKFFPSRFFNQIFLVRLNRIPALCGFLGFFMTSKPFGHSFKNQVYFLPVRYFCLFQYLTFIIPRHAITQSPPLSLIVSSSRRFSATNSGSICGIFGLYSKTL